MNAQRWILPEMLQNLRIGLLLVKTLNWNKKNDCKKPLRKCYKTCSVQNFWLQLRNLTENERQFSSFFFCQTRPVFGVEIWKKNPKPDWVPCKFNALYFLKSFQCFKINLNKRYQKKWKSFSLNLVESMVQKNFIHTLKSVLQRL